MPILLQTYLTAVLNHSTDLDECHILHITVYVDRLLITTPIKQCGCEWAGRFSYPHRCHAAYQTLFLSQVFITFVLYAVSINWQGFPFSACNNMCNIKSSLHAPPAAVVMKSSVGQTGCKSYIPRHGTQNLSICFYLWPQQRNTLLAPMSKDVTHVQHHDIRSRELQHHTINMDTTQKLIYIPKYGFHCAVFTKPTITQQTFVWSSPVLSSI